MLSLLPIPRVIAMIAVCYAVVIAIFLTLVWSTASAPSLRESVSVALGGATILLTTGFALGWKAVWALVPKLNTWLFPNLEGEWDMEIHWRKDAKTFGKVSAKAIIKQDFTRISMEVVSQDSDSETLIAQPKRDPESGRPILYYQYRVVPKAIGGNFSQPYNGAAILKFSNTGANQLSGNYFTSVTTSGHFVLTR